MTRLVAILFCTVLIILLAAQDKSSGQDYETADRWGYLAGKARQVGRAGWTSGGHRDTAQLEVGNPQGTRWGTHRRSGVESVGIVNR